MEFEVFVIETGKTFKKKVTPLAKALEFKRKCEYSRKVAILSWKYV